MAPALGGQASGLQVACQIANADISPQISIADYADAQWHHGGARAVFISAKRRGNAQAAPDPISAVVAVCPNNPQNVAANLVCAAGQPAVSVPAGHLTITAADVNHSVEFATSSPNLQGIFIAPGTFIKCVAAACVPALPAGQVQLSKPVLDNRSLSAPLCTNVNSVGKGCLPVQPNWGLCTNNVNPCFTPPQKVLVSNDTGRAVTDGTTTAGSLCIGSVGANFKAGDIGMGISGGDIPDSAVIDSIANVPPKVPVCGANQAHILCTGCAPGAPLTTANAQVITLSPSNAPSSSRYVTNANCTAGTRTLTNGGPAFAPSDVGLPVTFVPAIPALAGARIATIGANGATAGLGAGQTGAVLNNCPAGANKVVIGLATKTAPATGDSVATLAIVLNVDPGVSPTSPPCAANKTSGFQIPLSWRNPEGTPPTPVPPAPNVLATAGYNTYVGGTQLSGVSPAPYSIAQLDFRTASTSFSGYVQQTYTSPGNPAVQGPSSYVLRYSFLPVGVGVCGGVGGTGTDLATQWNIFGLSKKIVENPSFTGGGGGGVRGIKQEVQGGGTTYTGVTGAQVRVTNLDTPLAPMVNSCTINSPGPIPPEPGCNW